MTVALVKGAALLLAAMIVLAFLADGPATDTELRRAAQTRPRENPLYIVDRAKDMIITGGFNVYSVEVEQALRAHEAVQDCAVVGLPDQKWGERIVAVLQPRPGREIDAGAIAAFVKQQIGSIKTPKQIEVWNDLPRSKVGKVLKAEVRAKLLAY